MEAPSTRLRLRVSPGARQNAVVGRHGDAWKLRVSQPPEDGRANSAVVRLLADTLDLERDAVVIVSGDASRDKVVRLDGIEPDEVDRRLSEVEARRA